MTLSLSWSEASGASKLDFGIQNKDYIDGDWYKHDIKFTDDSSYVYASMATFNLSNVSYAGEDFLK